MQSFMMGVVTGMPPAEDKPLREHQKSRSELRAMTRKLAHVAGTVVILSLRGLGPWIFGAYSTLILRTVVSESFYSQPKETVLQIPR